MGQYDTTHHRHHLLLPPPSSFPPTNPPTLPQRVGRQVLKHNSTKHKERCTEASSSVRIEQFARLLPSLQVAAVSEAPAPESVAKSDQQFDMNHQDSSWRKRSVCVCGVLWCECVCCAMCALRCMKATEGVSCMCVVWWCVILCGVLCIAVLCAVCCVCVGFSVACLVCVVCAWCENVNSYLFVFCFALSQYLECQKQTCRTRKTRQDPADILVETETCQLLPLPLTIG